MSSIKEFEKRILAFRDERNWKQFHKPKDMALSLMLESAEVAEIFQWKKDADIESGINELQKDLGRELSDVLYWVVLLAHDCGVDLASAFEKKMAENENKYPVGTSRNSSKKYNHE